MGYESTAQYVSELVQTNPPTTDTKQQGDDHIRLIKTVLRNTFPNASKAIYFPDSIVKSAGFVVLAAQQNMTFLVSTASGATTMAMPTLAASDAGWACFLFKTTTDVNPVYITPPSGTIQSGPFLLTKTRRAIPGVPIRIFWTGSQWAVERAVAVPVGSIIDCDLTALPAGYELPNGQTLAGTGDSVYPDYFAAKGSLVTRDITGRVVAMKEAVATRLTAAVGGVDGATLGAAGGAQGNVLVQANLPSGAVPITIPAGQGAHTHSLSSNFLVSNGNSSDSGPGGLAVMGTPTAGTATSATLPAMSGTMSGGSDTPLVNLQPVIVLNKILVVE